MWNRPQCVPFFQRSLRRSKINFWSDFHRFYRNYNFSKTRLFFSKFGTARLEPPFENGNGTEKFARSVFGFRFLTNAKGRLRFGNVPKNFQRRIFSSIKLRLSGLFFFPLLFSNSLLLSNCRLKRCEKIWNFWKSAKDSRLSFLKFRIKHKTSTFIKRFLLSNLFPLRLIKINKQINNISFENWKIHEVKNF